MKEKPILFSGEMVRAILAGRKTQTRRILKPQPSNGLGSKWWWNGYCAGLEESDLDWLRKQMLKTSPYGQPGDMLWVRETWAKYDDVMFYCADGNDGCMFKKSKCKWKPSIHMPRWASRLTLEITNVRVERLNDISEEDAKTEGCKRLPFAVIPPDPRHTAKASFQHLWESINGPGSWDKNPWVWVIEFKKVTP